MSVFYLNDCGKIETGYFVENIENVCTIIRVLSLRTATLETYKIIDNYTGKVLAKENRKNQSLDPFKSSDHPFTEYDIRQVANELEQESPAYREVMHKLFMQKLEEYIKEQWKVNSTK